MLLGVSTTLLVAIVLVTGYRAQKFSKQAERDTPPVGQFVDVNGTKIHYVKQGSGPVLLMIHGAGGHLKDYTFGLVDRFSKDFTVIAIDRPAHGYTPALNNKGASLAKQSQLIMATAQALGAKDAYVLGYSYGGAVGLNMATSHPEFVKGLVLLSSVSMPWPDDIHITYRLAAKPIIGPAMMAFATAYFGDEYFSSRYETVFYPQTAPDGFLKHVGVNLSTRYKCFVENARQLNTLRPQIVAQSKLYKNLNIPVELIHGTADTSVPSFVHAEEFVKLVPQANLVSIKGMGHGTHQLATAQIEAAIYAVADAG
jgi:pimeloyl-ACP methyl ester carboxylesterase